MRPRIADRRLGMFKLGMLNEEGELLVVALIQPPLFTRYRTFVTPASSRALPVAVSV